MVAVRALALALPFALQGFLGATVLGFAHTVGEFGVVLMLFLVGLELEPARLWNLRRPIFGWGTAQVVACAAVLFAVGTLAGASWRVALVAALGLALVGNFDSVLSAWREAPNFYTERERAALAWTEAITQIPTHGVPDDLYNEVRKHFDEKALVDLTLAAISINSWNRMAIAFRSKVGDYVSPHGKQ